MSEHTTVMFECSTPEDGLTYFTLATSPSVGQSLLHSYLPNGVEKLTLTITNTNSYKIILVNCIALRNEESNQSRAFLKIQGMYSHYSLHLSET